MTGNFNEIDFEKLRPKEAALLLGCSEYTIRDLVRKKQIPCYRTGSLIMFRKSSLIKWIEHQEQSCLSE